MYDTNKQSKNGIVILYKHIVPENKSIKIGIIKNDRKLHKLLRLIFAKQFKTKWLIQQTISKLQELTMSITYLYK